MNTKNLIPPPLAMAILIAPLSMTAFGDHLLRKHRERAALHRARILALMRPFE